MYLRNKVMNSQKLHYGRYIIGKHRYYYNDIRNYLYNKI